LTPFRFNGPSSGGRADPFSLFLFVLFQGRFVLLPLERHGTDCRLPTSPEEPLNPSSSTLMVTPRGKTLASDFGDFNPPLPFHLASLTGESNTLSSAVETYIPACGSLFNSDVGEFPPQSRAATLFFSSVQSFAAHLQLRFSPTFFSPEWGNP